MKKTTRFPRIKSTVAILMSILLTCTFLFGFAAQPAQASSYDQYIGKEQAKSIAFEHAGVAATDVYHLDIELERENGKMVYDIEFRSNTSKYSYDINALTGEIVKYEQKQLKANNNTGNNSDKYIGKDQAQTIAFDHAGVAAVDVYKIDVELERENGRMVYDIEFRSDTTKYSYDINALTGEVIKYEHKQIKNNNNSGSATDQYIGSDKAQNIAFEHAGVSANKVYKLETKLKKDDGRMVYDVEFKSGKMEYEYEIDAISGTILDWEADRD